MTDAEECAQYLFQVRKQPAKFLKAAILEYLQRPSDLSTRTKRARLAEAFEDLAPNDPMMLNLISSGISS
jgi:hypothetical protein